MCRYFICQTNLLHQLQPSLCDSLSYAFIHWYSQKKLHQIENDKEKRLWCELCTRYWPTSVFLCWIRWSGSKQSFCRKWQEQIRSWRHFLRRGRIWSQSTVKHFLRRHWTITSWHCWLIGRRATVEQFSIARQPIKTRNTLQCAQTREIRCFVDRWKRRHRLEGRQWLVRAIFEKAKDPRLPLFGGQGPRKRPWQNGPRKKPRRPIRRCDKALQPATSTNRAEARSCALSCRAGWGVWFCRRLGSSRALVSLCRCDGVGDPEADGSNPRQTEAAHDSKGHRGGKGQHVKLGRESPEHVHWRPGANIESTRRADGCARRGVKNCWRQTGCGVSSGWSWAEVFCYVMFFSENNVWLCASVRYIRWLRRLVRNFKWRSLVDCVTGSERNVYRAARCRA